MSQRADLAMGPNSSTDRRRALANPSLGWFEGAGGLDVFAVIVAVLLLVAISPVMKSYTFTPKAAIALLLAAAGVPALIRLARAGTHGARAGLAFLIVALVSASISGSPLVGFFGMYLSGTGWIFWCAVVGAWALGASLSERGRTLLANGLLLAAVINALVTVAQQGMQLQSPVLGLYDGTQADGLLGNPIFLESILLGGLALLLVRATRESAKWCIPTALLAGSLELSGERFSIALLAALGLWALVVHRNRRAAFFAASLTLGYGFAFLATNALLHQRITQNVISNPRLLLWRTLAHAFVHRPILGYGPGQTITASTAYQSLALAKRLTVGILFNDAHDIFIEIAVTTGIVGLTTFLLFTGRIMRDASGPLLGFALFALVVELVEPLNIAVTPVIFLALGAAKAGGGSDAGRPRGLEAASRGALVAVAALAAVALLFGDYELYEGTLYFDYGAASLGANTLPIWSGPDLIAAEVAANRSIETTGHRYWLHIARQWQEDAVEHQPTNTQFWQDLAAADASAHTYRKASMEYQQALDLDRLNVQALVGLGNLDLTTHRKAEARILFKRALTVAPTYQAAQAGLKELNS